MSQDLSISSMTQTENATTLVGDRAVSRKAIFIRVISWGFLGLAWGAAMRAWMVTLALEFGDRPQFTWSGTFGAILLPAALMGATLGGAACAAETTTGSKRWRWAILSPLVLVLAPVIFLADFIPALLATGLGGGAIAVALIGLLGAYALSGLGASWLRWITGLLALLFTFAAGIGIYFGNRDANTPPGAGEAFGALFFILLMALLVAGISAPFRYQSK